MKFYCNNCGNTVEVFVGLEAEPRYKKISCTKCGKIAQHSIVPISEIENGVVACFGRKYKMMPIRVPGSRPNFHFYQSEDGVKKGKYRGAAVVMRVYGDMGKLDLRELGGIHWGDPKGLIIIGFDDVCAFKAPDRANFVTICRRVGCYV